MPRRNRCTGELEHQNGCTASAYVVSSVLALVLVLGVPLAHVMFFVDASPGPTDRCAIASGVDVETHAAAMAYFARDRAHGFSPRFTSGVSSVEIIIEHDSRSGVDGSGIQHAGVFALACRNQSSSMLDNSSARSTTGRSRVTCASSRACSARGEGRGVAAE